MNMDYCIVILVTYGMYPRRSVSSLCYQYGLRLFPFLYKASLKYAWAMFSLIT